MIYPIVPLFHAGAGDTLIGIDPCHFSLRVLGDFLRVIGFLDLGVIDLPKLHRSAALSPPHLPAVFLRLTVGTPVRVGILPLDALDPQPQGVAAVISLLRSSGGAASLQSGPPVFQTGPAPAARAWYPQSADTGRRYSGYQSRDESSLQTRRFRRDLHL